MHPAVPASSPAVRRLVARLEALRKARPEQAWRVLERDFAEAARAAGDAGRGELWRLRGHVLRSLQRAREAAVAYARAATWYRRARETREEGRCAIGLVDSLMYLGRYGEAQRAAARGRRLLQRAGDRASLARLLNNEGNLFHRLDLPERALLRYREARRALVRAGDRRGAAMVDGNVANCLSLVGRLDEARRLYRDARRVHAAAGFELDALTADYNLAYLDFLEQRYEAALAALARVGDEARGRGFAGVGALAALDRAEIFLRMGAHDEALAEARRAIEDCSAVELAYERAKAGTFAALAEFRLGSPAAARARLEHALETFHAEGNAVWSGEALVGLATIWWRDANPRAAGALLAAARRCFAAAGDREREGCARALLARARLESGDLAGAREELARLERGADTGPRGRSVGARASPRLRHLALAARAAVARARGDLAPARRWLRSAARESERLAARILDEHWRSTFWGEWGWPHRELAALELEQGRVAAALESLESGRGRAFAGPAARQPTGLGGRHRAAAAVDRARLRAVPGRPAPEGPLPPGVRAWAAARLAVDRLRVTRGGASPIARAPDPASPGARSAGAGPPASALAGRGPRAIRTGGSLGRALQSLPPRALRAAALRRALPPAVRLLDYMIHDGQLHLIVVDGERLTGHARLISERRLSHLVHTLLFDLRSAAYQPAEARFVPPALGRTLAELAAAALWPALGGGPLPQALALVPVGPLARLPWAALPLPDGRPLCEAVDLVVVPGLRLGLSRARPAAADGLEGRAPAARWCGEGRPLVVAADAGDLESVEPETRAVLEAFGDARLLSGAEATAERLLALAPRAPWLHFAGHGLYRADAPQESGLKLADRWLLAGELAELTLRARWVALSACQTARSLVRPGEEWFGLARSFLIAGARAVLASQWDITDEAAAQLMGGVYRGLRAGGSLAGALRVAQAARAAEGAHPLDWAGFVVLGGPSGALQSQVASA